MYNGFVQLIDSIVSIEISELKQPSVDSEWKIMEIRNVTTFVKIVEFNSFTKAAESIGYSQATVTAQIKALEAELGVPLFDRIGKRIFLTDAGQKFLPYALNLLNAEEEALHSVRPMDELEGELRICSASSYAAAVLPGFLLRFRKLHPGVNITVKISDYTEDTLLKLKRDEIDFMAAIDDGSEIPDFRTVYRNKEKVMFVTYPDNQLLDRKQVSLQEIINDDFIVADRSIGYIAMLENELRRLDLELNPVMEIGSVDAIIRLVMGGSGTTFIPEYIAADYISSGQIAEIPNYSIDVDLYSRFICNKNKWLNPIMKEFIHILNDR